MDLVCFWFVVL